MGALIPEDEIRRRLVLRWGDYQAATDVQFPPQPCGRRGRTGTPPPNVTTNRTHDEDTSVMSRSSCWRSETRPHSGSRGAPVSASPFNARSCRRAVARRRRMAPADKGLPADGPDFTRLATTPAGAVVLLTAAPGSAFED